MVGYVCMVSPCIDVLCHLTNCINTDLGACQGKKHASPDTKKDIHQEKVIPVVALG